jgi:type I restriction-modification system DNA methylase subunit
MWGKDLSRQDIDKIVETYQFRKEEERYSKRIQTLKS